MFAADGVGPMWVHLPVVTHSRATWGISSPKSCLLCVGCPCSPSSKVCYLQSGKSFSVSFHLFHFCLPFSDLRIVNFSLGLSFWSLLNATSSEFSVHLFNYLASVLIIVCHFINTEKNPQYSSNRFLKPLCYHYQKLYFPPQCVSMLYMLFL